MSRIAALFAAVSLIAASLVAFVPAHAAGGEINVADYLEAWDAMDNDALQKELEETGEINFDRHPHAKLVTEEFGKTAKAYREAYEADRAAGRTPHSCLPEGQVELNTDVLLPHLRSYDSARRGDVTLAQAFADLMLKTYPCD